MKYLLVMLLTTSSFSLLAADACKEEKKVEAQNLKTFDDLDYRVFSNQEWKDLHKSHAQNITVHFPDGHTTKGLETHIKDLSAMFEAMPDLKIKEHPIKIADVDHTAVQGVMEGTFTKPMKMADGKVVQPNGKKLHLSMVTIGVWKNGVMTEEYLYWDNATYMKQLGLL